MNMRGKWAEGIMPRNLIWIVKDRLAVCERPGGYGPQHRKVRRIEELIWIRRNDFKRVISIIPAAHNLHNYEEFDISPMRSPRLAAKIKKAKANVAAEERKTRAKTRARRL